MSNQPEKGPIEGEIIETEAAQVSDLKELVFVVKGQIVESNLSDIAQQISANIEAIPEELETEDDFNNAEKVAKQLREAKSQLAERRDKALQDAEELYAELQLIGEVEDKCVTKAKSLEKLVRDEKKRKREQMIDKSYASCEHHYDKYVDDHDDFRMARPAIPLFNIDQYPQIIKGCSSFTSMQARLDKQAKSIQDQTDDAFDAVMANANAIDATELPALFQDRKALLLMDAEHLGSEIRARVATHEAAEAKKAAEEKTAADKKAGEEKAEAERIAAESIEVAQNSVEEQDEQAPPAEQSSLESTPLKSTPLAPTGGSALEPDSAPPSVNLEVDNTPPFGDGADASVHPIANDGLTGSPVPVVKSPDNDEPVYRSLDVNISITATEARAKQIANIAHGRFKNMPEVHRVGLKDPNKKHNLIMDRLHEELNKAGHEANVERREGLAAAINIIEQVRGI